MRENSRGGKSIGRQAKDRRRVAIAFDENGLAYPIAERRYRPLIERREPAPVRKIDPADYVPAPSKRG